MAAVRFSNTPSEKILTAPPATGRRCRAASLDQVGQLGPAGLDLPAQGGHGPAGEPAPLGHRPVGGQHVRFHGGVLPGGDAQAVQVGLAALDGGLPLGLVGLGGEVVDQGLGRLVEGAGRLAGGVPLDPAPRRVGGDAVIPASLRARLLTQALWPSVDSSSTGRSRPPRPGADRWGRRCRRCP